jgi:hypothetical protein
MAYNATSSCDLKVTEQAEIGGHDTYSPYSTLSAIVYEWLGWLAS